jgi:hypothetical protein
VACSLTHSLTPRTSVHTQTAKIRLLNRRHSGDNARADVAQQQQQQQPPPLVEWNPVTLCDAFAMWKTAFDEMCGALEGMVVVSRPLGDYGGRMRPVLERTPAQLAVYRQRRSASGLDQQQEQQQQQQLEARKGKHAKTLSTGSVDSTGSSASSRARRRQQRRKQQQLQQQQEQHPGGVATATATLTPHARGAMTDEEKARNDAELMGVINEEMQLLKLQTLLAAAQARNHQQVKTMQVRERVSEWVSE